MPIEDFEPRIFETINAAFVVKSFLILLLIFYVVFALMLYRQVQLMCKTLPTQLSPILKFLAIIHLGISLAFLFVIIGVF